MLRGDWSRAIGGFRGYPLSWIRSDGVHGVGKLGTNAPRRPNEIHVDLSGGLVSALPLEQICTLLRWVHEQQGHVTLIDCALDDRAGTVAVSTIRQAVADGHCVTRAAQVRQIVSNLTRGTGATTGETMYFASSQSQTLLRIYDKRLEMQSKERENWQAFGVRWELEFKQDGPNSVRAPWSIWKKLTGKNVSWDYSEPMSISDRYPKTLKRKNVTELRCWSGAPS